MTMHLPPAPNVTDIRAAADRLAGLAVRTPLIESPALSDRLGARILFKPEMLQRTGSFKFRGAYNRIAQLSPEERARGVVAFSSGNHAQGVAAAARLFGVDALIAMPSDAPRVKVDNVEAMGAKVIRFDRFGDDRMAVVRPYMEEGRVLVPPFDDPAIIAGQGTAGLEILADAEPLGLAPDVVVAPCGGGGLIAGLSLAIKAHLPKTEIWAVEPEGFDDTRRSLAAGRRVSIEPGHGSICDAIQTPSPGEITFEVNRRLLAGAVAVPDAATMQAMRDVALHLKLVVEPGGAVGLAAISSGAIDVKGKCVVVVLSGGNADPVAYGRIIAAE